MQVRTETPDLIEIIVNSMNSTFVGGTWVDNGGSYTIHTCNPLWLQPCFELKIDGVTYKITEVTSNSLTVTGASLPTLTTFEIYRPKFFHGTVTQVTTELDKIDWSKDKLPMIYLNEGVLETFYLNDNSADRESSLNLFFLTEADYEDWLTSDDYEQAKLPMRRLAYAFIEAVDKSRLTLRVDDYTVINRDKMAITVGSKGSTKKIFNDDLSGVDMRVDISFSREGCKC